MFIKKEDFQKVVSAMRTISIAIMPSASSEFTSNGQDYCAVAFVIDPRELQDAVHVMCDFVDDIVNSDQ